MLKPKTYSSLILIVFLSLVWVLFYNIQTIFLPKYQTIPVSFPKEKDGPYIFSVKSVLAQIEKKRKILIELNEDKVTNQNKMNLIRYEARKIKYINDTSTVIHLTFSIGMNYREMLHVIQLCIEENIYYYAPIKKGFVIFPGFYPPPKDTTKKLELIYL